MGKSGLVEAGFLVNKKRCPKSGVLWNLATFYPPYSIYLYLELLNVDML